MVVLNTEVTHYLPATLIVLHYQEVSGLEAMEIKIKAEGLNLPFSGVALQKALEGRQKW